MEDYGLAVGMYKQYQEDVAIVGKGLNIYQLKTLQLLENNFRGLQPKKVSFFRKIVGAFRNRRK
jgi:hypothetical protein